jgi:hypothetical protein
LGNSEWTPRKPFCDRSVSLIGSRRQSYTHDVLYEVWYHVSYLCVGLGRTKSNPSLDFFLVGYEGGTPRTEWRID